MPIVGFSSSEQSSGGQFSFAEGRGRVVNAVFVNHAIPGYDTDCKWRLTIQRLGSDGKPTTDDPIDEMLGFGKTEHFHPGLATSPTDNDPNLEFGGSKDMGYGEGAEGNCLLGTKNPDKTCKAAIFTRSAEEQGLKKDLFNGRWAGAIIGLEAHFSQFMMKKSSNAKPDKEPPTCLIIGKGGQMMNASVEKLVYKYPDGTGVAQIDTGAAGGSTGRATPPRPTPAGATVTPINQPVNGAPAPETGASTAQSAPSDAAWASEDDADTAARMVGSIGKVLAGQTVPRKRFETRSLVEMNGEKMPAAKQQAVKKLIKDDKWFAETAADYGWVVTGTGEVQIPAAG